MINYDKLGKVGEYKDGSLTWFTDKEENVVYLIRIGEDSYIGSTTNIRRRFAQYVADLKHIVYCSPKVQDAFNEKGRFIIYLLERVTDASNLRTREQFFIDLISPNLNSTIASSSRPKKRSKMQLRIKEVAKEKGITINSLAEIVGITRANMSNIVNGKSTPLLDTLERIANALNVDITDLFKKNDSGEDVNGFVRVKGTIYEIHSFDDLEKVLKLKEE